MQEKTFTLIGMSGAGKTALSQRLVMDGFFHYSIDSEIAYTHLKESIRQSVVQNIKKQSPLFKTLMEKFAIKFDISLTFDDLEIITMFVIPQQENGKINLGEFRRNQSLYREAEKLATKGFVSRAKIAFQNYHVKGFINDATGSICEIALGDEEIIDMLKHNSTVIYLKTSSQHRQMLSERSKKAVKPILYNPQFLMENLQSYYGNQTFDDMFEIDPEFFIDLFPKLLEFRVKSYDEFVQKTNGKAIDVSEFYNVHNVRDFLEVVNAH